MHRLSSCFLHTCGCHVLLDYCGSCKTSLTASRDKSNEWHEPNQPLCYHLCAEQSLAAEHGRPLDFLTLAVIVSTLPLHAGQTKLHQQFHDTSSLLQRRMCNSRSHSNCRLVKLSLYLCCSRQADQAVCSAEPCSLLLALRCEWARIHGEQQHQHQSPQCTAPLHARSGASQHLPSPACHLHLQPARSTDAQHAICIVRLLWLV